MELFNILVLITLIFIEYKGRMASHVCKMINVKKKADCSNLKLTSVPQTLPTNISTLILDRNRLTVLTNKTFEKYIYLKHIAVNQNKIKYLEENVFAGIMKLEQLSLEGNYLSLEKSFPRRVFRNIPALKSLDIRRNDVKRHLEPVQYPYFGYLKNLEILLIDLVDIPLLNNTGLRYLSKLRKLRFSSCNLLKMENKTFIGMPGNVEYIYFTNCKYVEVVEPNFLGPFPHLKSLSLHHTYIHLSRALRLLYPLQHKNMTTIAFERVTADFQDSVKYPCSVKVTVEMMRYLQTICVGTLILAENGIVDFEPGSLLTYRHPECFKRIILTGNRFSLTTGNNKKVELLLLMKQLTNLELFDFSYNPIKYVNISYNMNKKKYGGSDYLPKELDTYEVDDPNNRCLDCITNASVIVRPPYTVGELDENMHETSTTNLSIALPPKLAMIRLSFFLTLFKGDKSLIFKNASNLNHVDISYFQMINFPDIILENSVNLEYLDISGIDSTLYCTKKYLTLFHNARKVILQDARLSEALLRNRNVMSLFPKVEDLDISNNNLWFLPNDAFSKNTYLKNLTMKWNLLRQLPKAIILLTKLEFLDISYNYLQEINITMINWIDQQNDKIRTKFRIFMWGNIFRCTCDTADFIQWIYHTKIRFKKTHFYCHLINGSETNTLEVCHRFHDYFSYCDSATWLRIGIGCLVTFAVVTIPIAIIFNFRWKIALLIYKKFKRVVEKGIRQKYKYDIYVSYGMDTAVWIKNTLLPKVEVTWGMRLCIADRDILAGEMSADAIALAIKESRHVLFIISEEFIHKQWTAFEIDRTKYEKYANVLQKIIVIIRDSNPECVPIELDNIWQDIIVVDWSKDDNENGWDKLRTILFSETF